MGSPDIENRPVGVIGAGSFGTAIANLLAENKDVLIYARRPEVVEAIGNLRKHRNQVISPRVSPTNDLQELAERCTLIFPVVDSKNFRKMMREVAPFLEPSHILIHGTKGLDVSPPLGKISEVEDRLLSRDEVKTMSEVIMEESVVVKVGSLAGPNLAGEIAKGYPAGTVIASRFREVFRVGQAAIRSQRFQVYGNYDLLGIELAGVLKNILAIGSGMISGLELGENARALLITRGWVELMKVAELFGSDQKAFLGLAGIGDLIATCSSPMSRNYTVGYRLAKGQSLEEIVTSMEEVAEGINTIRTAHGLVRHYKVRAPIIMAFFAVLFRGLSLEQAIRQLMNYPHLYDVDFI